MNKRSQQAQLRSSPALHAFTDSMSKLFHRMANAAQESGLEVTAGLSLHTVKKEFAIQLRKLLIDHFHLARGLRADELHQGCFVSAPAIHRRLHSCAIRVEVKLSFLSF